jgi:AraC family transcriptional regulator, regulatory protein of adaptative response / methylated-DNA-[protein]-cysteine methyltransferase
VTDDDDRWQAVLARATAADGEFVYGVVTTGVYCRPTCPSRRPRRANVRFFGSAAEAAAGGLRPCRRCEPDGPGLARRRADMVAAACRQIEEAADEPTLTALADAAGMSPHHFHRVFKSVTGLTPKAYAAAHRASRVRAALRTGPSVTDAIYDAGFGSSGRFYASSGARLGMTPTQYRNGGDGARVRFALGRSSLGPMLVAASDRGVCAIQFGDDPAALVSDLQVQLPRAESITHDPDLEALVADVVGMVEHGDRTVDLPLDLRGTAFQERVWQALRGIPAGTTATYAQVADSIGSPTAVRAVAAACAANRLAVAIPCHRVVRSDGSLAGYRWGVERKRALLEREGALPPPDPATDQVPSPRTAAR